VVVGTPLSIQGPFGTFALPDTLGDSLLLIAGGTGIAPLRAMMWDLLERVRHPRLTLLYSARSQDEFAYRDELQRLAAEQRINLVMTVTRDQPETWSGERGRLNEALIRRLLNGADTQCVVCGPATLVADTTAILRALGVKDVVTETYSTREP
jgi:ferredoxin-NADP reductase